MAEKDKKQSEKQKTMLLIGLSAVGGIIFLTQTLPVLMPKGGAPAKPAATAEPAAAKTEKVAIPSAPKTTAAASVPALAYGGRDPFVFGMTPKTVEAEEEKEEAPEEETPGLDLISVENGVRTASIDGEDVKVGGTVLGWKVVKITDTTVIIKKGVKQVVLTMEE